LRVHAVDKVDLLRAGAAFNLLLSGDSRNGVVRNLVEYQLADIIATGKAGNQFHPMLIDSLLQITGDARIENGVALVGQDVDEVLLFHVDEIASLRSQ
jgi:hypothetical protein